MIREMRDVLAFLRHERFWWLSTFLLVMSVLMITFLIIGPAGRRHDRRVGSAAMNGP